MEESEYRPLVYKQYTMEEFLIYITRCLDKYTYSKIHISEMIKEFLFDVNNKLVEDLDLLLFPYLVRYPTAIMYIKYIKTVDIHSE